MSTFVVIVEFTIRDGSVDDFLPHMIRNARTSLECESGCERFDVLRPEGDGHRVLLYEVYRDRAAFESHGRSSHYLAFADATRAFVRDKAVTFCSFAASAAP